MRKDYDVFEYTKEDEKIVDTFYPKNELSKDIFDADKKMHQNVRKKLIEIGNEFIDFLKIEFFIHDIILTGSLANYNWSKYSDVDLHIIIDFEDDNFNYDFLKEFFDAKKRIWNLQRNINIKGFDVELYVQDVNEKHESTGVYSVLNNKWIVEPTKDSKNIDAKKILNKADYFMNIIDDLDKKSKNKDTSIEIEKVRKKIEKFRKSGLEKNGEYSYENLVFKLLRRNNYIKKLLDLKNIQIDKKLSIA